MYISYIQQYGLSAAAVALAMYFAWPLVPAGLAKLRGLVPAVSKPSRPTPEQAFAAVQTLCAYYDGACAEGLAAAQECGRHLFHKHGGKA